MLILTFLTKAVIAGAIVLGLSAIAERLSPRIAGIVSGAPLGALISYYLLGIEKGINFVAYHAVSIRVASFNALKSTLVGLAAFLAGAFVIHEIHFTILSALPVTMATAVLAGFVFRRALRIYAWLGLYTSPLAC